MPVHSPRFSVLVAGFSGVVLFMAGAIWVSSSVPQINAAPEYDTEKIFQYEGQEVRVPYREKMPPDTTACIFWLKNRKKAEWRDGVGVQHDATSAFLQVLDSFGHKGRPRLSAETLAKRHPGRD